MSRQYTQPGTGGAAPGSDKFLSDENRRMLYGILSKDFIKRGVTLTPKLAGELDLYLNHYVDEVYSVQGSKPLTFLNKEVLVTTAQEFTNSVLKKPAAAAPPAQGKPQAQQQPVQQVITAVRATGKPTTTGPQGLPDNASAGAGTSLDSLFMDTSSRFDALQKERMEVKKTAPPMPEFKIDFTDDGPSPMELYERAKKAREEALAALPAPGQGAQTPVDVFVPADTSTPRVTPGPMNEFLDSIATSSRDKGIATSSPNLTTPVDNREKILSQQVVIKDDDVVNYKEIENNLIIYSADRDWVNNGTDNRYNFSVNFDPANNKQGFGLSPSSYMKFKNIVRIEFVKAILPAEGLDVIIQQTATTPSTVYNTNINANALSFPYLTLHIDEYRGNNYGTDNHLDNAFAILQYDALWTMDTTNNAANRGYVAFIPKNLKAQRVWMPTPLATLTRLSLRLERPDGTPLQTNLDTSVVSDVLGSQETTVSASTFYNSGGPARYLFVKTTKYFSKFSIQVGDRILFKDFTATNATYPAAATQMNTYMNQETGHLVAGIAYDDAGTIRDGTNIVGYANFIILETRMVDPTTGSTAVDPFGGTNTIHDSLLGGSTTYTGNLINLNRQTQFVFRVITREMDAASRLRPDNLN